MKNGIEAALRLYPTKTREIRRLAFANGSFRLLCDDLAEAQAALARLTMRPPSDPRRKEFEVLVEELSLEIENFVELHARA